MVQRVLFLFLILGLFSCKSSVKGEGQPDFVQDYPVQSFNNIKAEGSFKLLLIPNDTAYISVQTHKNLIENISVQSNDNDVEITEKEPVSSFEEYVVYVYYKDNLEETRIAGKVLLESQDVINSNEFNLEVRDNAIVRQFELNVKELDLTVEDKAEVTLNGETSELDLETTDFAKVTLEDFKADDVQVDLSDNSHVYVWAKNELEGVVTSNAVLLYKGNPSKDVDLKDKGQMNNK